MISYLNIIIDIALLIAVAGMYYSSKINTNRIFNLIDDLYRKVAKRLELPFSKKELFGRLEKTEIKAAIAEKTGDRAFNIASSATLGVMALQKSLATPRLITKRQATQNQLAKHDIEKLYTTEGSFDYLRSVMTDEELDILDSALAHQQKANGKEN